MSSQLKMLVVPLLISKLISKLLERILSWQRAKGIFVKAMYGN